MAASEAVNQLLVQLPQAKSAAEVFGLFAEKVHSIIHGLQHVSLLLLPVSSSQHDAAAADCSTISTISSSSSRSRSTGKGTSSGSKGLLKGPGRQGGSGAAAGRSVSAQQAPQPDASTDLSSRAPQAFRAGCGLDWNNCCVFNLYAGRGPVVQAPPSWPVTCTATCYAAVGVQDVVTAANYAAEGPHFLDWKALAEHGNVSMAAVPMFSCNKPVAVLCFASKQEGACSSVSTLRLLAGLLAPYCSMLTYSTRQTEMRRLVNDIIAPIAAQLAQQKHSQLAKLGCTVEEAPPGSVPTDGKGISVAVGNRKLPSSNSSASVQSSDPSANGGSPAVAQPVNGSSGSAKQRRSVSSKGTGSSKSSSKGIASPAAAAGASQPAKTAKQPGAQALSHKRFESVMVKGGGFEPDTLSGSADSDLDWSDWCFNLASMAIVYAYFSKSSAAGDSMMAIMLCMVVAGLDITLMVMRWLWYDQYMAYGSVVVTFLQAYRVVVLPVANTWMSWSLLHKMSIKPSGPVIVLLGVVLLACVMLGLQVRFFLHAPLQLASVLFAAMSTPEICGALFNSSSNIRCVGVLSTLQLSLGLLLPSVCVYVLKGRSGRVFLPHMQAKRWLMNV